MNPDESAAYSEFQEATRQLAAAEQAVREAQARYKAAQDAMHQFALRPSAPKQAKPPK